MRMLAWLLISLALALVIALIAPHQVGITVYKLSLITAAAWLGYWLDRHLFPGARPHELDDAARADLARMRRAIIISAVVIAVALGA